MWFHSLLDYQIHEVMTDHPFIYWYITQLKEFSLLGLVALPCALYLYSEIYRPVASEIKDQDDSGSR